jgi:hypothetical protein
LQNQVWELLQQAETFNPEPFAEDTKEDDIELFPFTEIIQSPATTDSLEINTSEDIPEEWTSFLENLPGYELQVLKAIVEGDNIQATLKKIAEANITMPNLLIDSINERANDTIGELIIDPESEVPEVYQEHKARVKKMIAIYDELMTRHAQM